MLPFPVDLRPGESPYRQVTYAATKAIVAGTLPPGAPFPSVRELSTALRINPNTAHKVVTELVRAGLLEVLPGVGTVVARGRAASDHERQALLMPSTADGATGAGAATPLSAAAAAQRRREALVWMTAGAALPLLLSATLHHDHHGGAHGG